MVSKIYLTMLSWVLSNQIMLPNKINLKVFFVRESSISSSYTSDYNTGEYFLACNSRWSMLFLAVPINEANDAAWKWRNDELLQFLVM